MRFGLLMEGGRLMLILGMNGIEAMGLPDELGGTLGCSVIHCQLQGVAMIISILREPIDSDATANDAKRDYSMKVAVVIQQIK